MDGSSYTLDTPVNIPVGDLLANDSDSDGGTLAIQSVQAISGGSVTLSGGNVQFTPTDSGTASFRYTVSDGQGGFTTADVTINNIPSGGGGSLNAITGDSGNNTLTGTDGADLIRAGAGQDTVTGGDGDDVFVMVGTTAADQYQTSDFNNGSYDLSGVVSLATLNNQGTSEAVSGESIDGGAGNDTLHVFGTIDLAGVNLSNIENIIVHSDVTFAEGQLSSMGVTAITGDGGSAVRIADNGSASDNLTGITMSNIAQFDMASGVTATMNQDNVDAIAAFSNKGAVTGSSLSFAGKSVYGAGTVDGDSAATWKATATSAGGFDLAQGVSGMQTFIGLQVSSFSYDGSSYTYPGPGYQSNNSYPASLNYHLESMNITAVDADNLNESTLDLLVGNQGQAEILEGTDRQDFILGSNTGGDTIGTGGGTLNFVMSRGGNDTITGGSGTDFISSGAGNDTINSGDAQDFVTTNDIDFADGSFSLLNNDTAGDDTINTGAGNDFLAVGGNLQATDQMDGGADTDYLVFSGNYNSADALTFGATTAVNFETFIFEGSNPQNNAETYTYDLTTHDATVATGSTLTVQAAGVSTTFSFDGSAETDGAFEIYAGDGADTISGGSGADQLSGSSGNDTLTGNGGNDLFLFYSSGHGTDTIEDFSHSDDTIVLNSSGFNSGAQFTDSSVVAVDADEFRSGAGANSATGGEFLIYDTTSGALYYDADASGGDFSAVQIATLTGSPDDVDNTDFTLQSLS